jgi:hypothetical protein
MRTKLLRLILLSLNACDGRSMPESALISAAQMASRPDEPTDGDVFDALKIVEGRGWASGVSDELMGRSWTLTQEGRHRVRQLH